MLHSAAAFTTEREADIGTACAPTVQSVSLEEQYELLCSFNVSPWLSRGGGSRRSSIVSTSSTASRFSVDLISEEGEHLSTPTVTVASSAQSNTRRYRVRASQQDVGILLEETNELCSECCDIACLQDVDPVAACELGPDASMHVTIDEEDDDIYFSAQKSQELSTGCSNHTCLEDGAALDTAVACELGSAVLVYADIDEEDDDIFFSLHRPEEKLQEDHDDGDDDAASICIPQSDQTLNVSADINEEDDDAYVSLHRPDAKLQEDDDGSSAIQEASDVSTECSDQACLEDVAAFDLVVACEIGVDPSVQAHIPQANASGHVVLRPVVSADMRTAADATGIAPALFANLKGGRAQGVRNFLARKLTPVCL